MKAEGIRHLYDLTNPKKDYSGVLARLIQTAPESPLINAMYQRIWTGVALSESPLRSKKLEREKLRSLKTLVKVSKLVFERELLRTFPQRDPVSAPFRIDVRAFVEAAILLGKANYFNMTGIRPFTFKELLAEQVAILRKDLGDGHSYPITDKLNEIIKAKIGTPLEMAA